ncbi:hypothetical protein F5Y16DRAFT_411218 [Xylariaceae sp. FL0255]|nr:hypothetical protein F5Y16DRAFT_411218 [Xylariaceae sp. FL0255]
MEGPSFEIPPFEFDNLDLNYDADSPNQSNDPSYFGRQGGGQIDAESDEDENVYDSFSEVLESELATLVTSRLPEPGYQPDETLITVSTSKRGEPSFLKRFDKLSINWAVIENKLESWCSQSSNLKVAISFIYKETRPPNGDGKTGRGATRKHSAALGRLVAQQEASGTRACSSAACANRGFFCWRYDDKHYKLDSNIIERLVDFAEKGHKLETHTDVLQGIREMIFIRKEEEEVYRLRKRKASEPLPINIRVFCHKRRDEASPNSIPKSENQSVQIDFPVSKDKAPVTIAKRYNLHWLSSYQKAGKKILVKNRVLEGMAARFVN